MNDIIQKIIDERKRQDAKWGQQDRDDLFWLYILSEEIGEVAKEILNQEPSRGDFIDAEKLTQELIRTAAVVVAWLECIERA